ncbi:MAG: M48 family peptidase [Anaerolineales bacterium]|nr:MAG: M48 family peptidase [Anaerolineales bacterium]
MALKKHQIIVGDLVVEVVRKRIKHLHFTVYPPDGRVRVSTPFRLSEDALRLAILSKLPWIKRHQARLANQVRPAALAYVSGETHDVLGQRCRLNVIEHQARPRVALGEDQTLDLYVRAGSDRSERERVMLEWYRQQLKTLIPPIIARWEPIIGEKVSVWGVKRMKTKWGSCSIKARRIWLNLELAKRPIAGLEYVIVHEMVHLLERRHNDRFYGYLDEFMPGWRQVRDALNAAPIQYNVNR